MFVSNISECLETCSGLSRAMYFGVLERVEDGWLLVGAGSFSSSSCFLAGLRELFAPRSSRTNIRTYLRRRCRHGARMCVSTIEIRRCRRRRRRVNVTRMCIGYVTRVTALRVFAGDTRDSALADHDWVYWIPTFFRFLFFPFLFCNFFISFSFNDNEISRNCILYVELILHWHRVF